MLSHCFAAAGSDYKSISSFGLVFETGDSRKCHSIIINGDQFFEQPPERFYANLTLGKGGSGVTLKPSGAAVLIFDSKCINSCSNYTILKSIIIQLNLVLHFVDIF